MSKLNELIQAAQQNLPITVRHEQWLATNASVRYPAEHIQRAAELLIGGDRERIASFSSSSAGDCHRRQVFGYIGFPQKPIDPAVANRFHTGNFLHIKWQLAGLTEGWLAEIEIPVISKEYRLKGTMDGKLWDGSGFEFKSINSYGYSEVMSYGPKTPHNLQMHAYMLLDDLAEFSIVYENKNNGEWREFRVPRNEETISVIKKHLEQLNFYIDQEVLPPILPECKSHEGKYLQCPYRDKCLKTRTWKNARDTSSTPKTRPVQSAS